MDVFRPGSALAGPTHERYIFDENGKWSSNENEISTNASFSTFRIERENSHSKYSITTLTMVLPDSVNEIILEKRQVTHPGS